MVASMMLPAAEERTGQQLLPDTTHRDDAMDAVASATVTDFVPNPHAKEFVPGAMGPPGLLNPLGLLHSPTAVVPPGLLETKSPVGLDIVDDEAEGAVGPPPGLELVAPGLGLAASKLAEATRLAEENRQLSKQFLELQTARLVQENELLRAQLLMATSAAAGPPGVFQRPAAGSDGPPGVFASAELREPGAPPVLDAPPGLDAVCRDEESGVSGGAAGPPGLFLSPALEVYQGPPGAWAPPGLSAGACDCCDSRSEASDASTEAISELSQGLSASRRQSSFSDESSVLAA